MPIMGTNCEVRVCVFLVLLALAPSVGGCGGPVRPHPPLWAPFARTGGAERGQPAPTDVRARCNFHRCAFQFPKRGDKRVAMCFVLRRSIVCIIWGESKNIGHVKNLWHIWQCGEKVANECNLPIILVAREMATRVAARQLNFRV